MPSTVARRSLSAVLLVVLATVVLAIGGLTAACGGENPYQSAQTVAASPDATIADDINDPDLNDNEFLPVRENVTECIGAVERPDCGSTAKGGWRMYLTFTILIAGMSFIGWRVARSVRARDAVVNKQREQDNVNQAKST